MNSSVIFEVCIDSVQGALAAAEGGADRLELCSGLAEGGVTPSLGLVQSVVDATPVPVMVMIRPRGGGYQYTASELESMLSDVALVADTGAHGVVFGCLDANGGIERDACRRLVQAARPMSVTFHRAIDVAADLMAAVQSLVDLGIERILTSGQAVTAEQGIETIAELNQRFGEQMVIMPGCGLNAANAKEIVSQTGVREVHGSASSWEPCVDAPTEDGQPGRCKVTDVNKVAAIRNALNAQP